MKGIEWTHQGEPCQRCEKAALKIWGQTMPPAQRHILPQRLKMCVCQGWISPDNLYSLASRHSFQSQPPLHIAHTWDFLKHFSAFTFSWNQKSSWLLTWWVRSGYYQLECCHWQGQTGKQKCSKCPPKENLWWDKRMVVFLPSLFLLPGFFK